MDAEPRALWRPYGRTVERRFARGLNAACEPPCRGGDCDDSATWGQGNLVASTGGAIWPIGPGEARRFQTHCHAIGGSNRGGKPLAICPPPFRLAMAGRAAGASPRGGARNRIVLRPSGAFPREARERGQFMAATRWRVQVFAGSEVGGGGSAQRIAALNLITRAVRSRSIRWRGFRSRLGRFPQLRRQASAPADRCRRRLPHPWAGRVDRPTGGR